MANGINAFAIRPNGIVMPSDALIMSISAFALVMCSNALITALLMCI